TVRGLPYFGHHFNLISLAYVPAYWLGAGPHFLYLAETIALAAGAVPLWLLGRDRLGRKWPALVPAGAYLLHPTVEWINWWHWHPDALAITPLLFAWWFATRRRWGWFAAAVAVTLSTKEDAALAVAALGLVVLWRGGRPARRAGLATAATGTAWFAFVTLVAMPAFSGGAPFYAQQFFPKFGSGVGSVVWGMATHPVEVVRVLVAPNRLSYYWHLLAPTGLVGLLGAPLLLVGAPQTAVNALSSLPGPHDPRFHYSSMVVAAIFLATVEGAALARRRHPRLGAAALVSVAAAALAANVAWSPSPLGVRFDSGIWLRTNEHTAALDRAVAMVPAGAGVSASYNVVAHLTHRRIAYEWPNPWRVGNWAIHDEKPPDPGGVDYIVLDTSLGQAPGVLASLTGPSGAFDVVLDDGGALVARRRSR
ncbi:MAG TPA: DUF2079 domain-containing protein, partial [Acidimicrobiales bacterium]|nr:DUF2079 domain-containing protein [Acidimicrobiales bacterium]